MVPASRLRIALSVSAFAVSACGPQPAGKPPAFPPAAVAIQVVQPADLAVEFEYVGQTAGLREVEVRARVGGILEKRNFEEGSAVRAGQLLFTLDSAQYEAALARTEAEAAASEARLEQAKRNAARLKPLWEAKAASQKDYDDALSAESIGAAEVKAARARAQEARLNLQYTRVESPIAGIAGRAQRPEGSLVSGADALLTTVTQIDPVYVVFGVPDAERMRLRADAQRGELRLPKDGKFDVEVRLADGAAYPRRGKLDFESVRVDAATGTTETRATLPNPDGLLHPGQFARVRLLGALRPGAIKIPQRAVLEGPQGKFVYVVNAESKAEPRPVQVAEWAGDDWVITKGLQAGDKVIVDGLMRIGPGAPVQASDPATAKGPAEGKAPQGSPEKGVPAKTGAPEKSPAAK